MTTHRIARTPPAGPVAGKKLTMCGRYLPAEQPNLTLTDGWTTCKICLRAMTGTRNERKA